MYYMDNTIFDCNYFLTWIYIQFFKLMTNK